MNYELQKLLDAEKKYGKIVIGLDFDDTIFPLEEDSYVIDRCKLVRETILKIQDRADICLWTVAADWSIKYKIYITKSFGIHVDYVNESPIEFGVEIRKPHFNILLDDKAGLNETIKLLQEFNLNKLNKL